MQSPFLVTIDTLHKPSYRGTAKHAVAARLTDAAISTPALKRMCFRKERIEAPRTLMLRAFSPACG
jgi:hypothetical protein